MHPRRPVRYADLNRELLERVPEIFQGYAQLKAMWDGDEPGPHILYEDLLVPFLTTLLSTGGEIALVTVFAFLEELAESNDQEVRNVLGRFRARRSKSTTDDLGHSSPVHGP